MMPTPVESQVPIPVVATWYIRSESGEFCSCFFIFSELWLSQWEGCKSLSRVYIRYAQAGTFHLLLQSEVTA